VRFIFRRYAELGSVRLLKDEMDACGIHSKLRTSASGRRRGGKPFARGALYLMLQNRIYRGEIVHKEQSHPGECTRRSSISRCGMRFRHSWPATPPSGTQAQDIVSRASSPACCLMATAIG
jgi:hypothetical protein